MHDPFVVTTPRMPEVINPLQTGALVVTEDLYHRVEHLAARPADRPDAYLKAYVRVTDREGTVTWYAAEYRDQHLERDPIRRRVVVQERWSFINDQAAAQLETAYQAMIQRREARQATAA